MFIFNGEDINKIGKIIQEGWDSNPRRLIKPHSVSNATDYNRTFVPSLFRKRNIKIDFFSFYIYFFYSPFGYLKNYGKVNRFPFWFSPLFNIYRMIRSPGPRSFGGRRVIGYISNAKRAPIFGGYPR